MEEISTKQNLNSNKIEKEVTKKEINSIKINTKFIGKSIEQYKIIDSTQLEIHRRIKQKNIENGLIIMSERQTKGKGTHGRIWHTDEGNNIAFSLYVETNCVYQKLDGITIEIAKTILNVFKKVYHIDLQIKEPNDIVYNRKKIGGILTEAKVLKDKVKYLVIGIGINTNKQEFSEDIKEIATSIKKEFNINVDNILIIEEFCKEFEELLLKIVNGDGDFDNFYNKNKYLI